MALTRPKYSQIYDTDYKQSVRLATIADLGDLTTLLNGGMPIRVDDINVAVNDRILVKDQAGANAYQNGIYRVVNTGTGTTGTWVRDHDADSSEKVTAGLTTTVVEGITNANTTWKLSTPDPIVLGTTLLTFVNPFLASGLVEGTNTNVQFNDLGAIGGTGGFTFDKTSNTVTVGNTISTGNLFVSAAGYVAGSEIITNATFGNALGNSLQTITYLPSYITMNPNVVPESGTTITYGTYNFGNLQSISVYGDYDTVANVGFYSVNDATGAPAHVEYIGWTGITKFNRVPVHINYTQSSGHTIDIDLYNYQTTAWDTFATYSGSPGWQTFALGLIDDVPYIQSSTGNVALRIYHVSSGNVQHRTWIDYVALEQSTTGGQGPRGATGATGATGPTGAGVAAGGTLGQVLTKNSSTNYDNFIRC